MGQSISCYLGISFKENGIFNFQKKNFVCERERKKRQMFALGFSIIQPCFRLCVYLFYRFLLNETRLGDEKIAKKTLGLRLHRRHMNQRKT